MLYLFNSGGKPQYISNVCNTLYLPKGAKNTYQYSSQYMMDDFDNVKEGDPAIIVFVDTAENKYYPLRYATLLKFTREAGRGYFDVQLGGYLRNSIKLLSFQNEITNQFGDSLFRREADCTSGYLAFTGTELNCLQNNSTNEKESELWASTVKRIMNCACFQSDCVFTKFLLTDKKGKELHPIAGTTDYCIKRNHEYNLILNHINDIDSLSCRPSASPCVENPSVMWGNNNGVTTHKVVFRGDDNIVIYPEITTDNGDKIKKCANASIKLVAKTHPVLKNILRFGSLLFFALSIFISTVIASYDPLDSNTSICEPLKIIANGNVKYFVLGACAVIDGLMMFILDLFRPTKK